MQFVPMVRIIGLSKKAFKVWCEWNIGQENLVFLSKTKANEWLGSNENLSEILEDDDRSIDDLFEQGLLSIEDVRLM